MEMNEVREPIAPSTSAPHTTAKPSQRPARIGFGIGVLVAVAGFGVLVSPGDGAETPPETTAFSPTPAAVPKAAAVPQHATGRPLDAETQARVTALQQRIGAATDNLSARKELAVMFMGNAQLLPAFEQASEILKIDPQDPDALYVHGVVRLRMGQGARAIQLLDRLLADHPIHIPALIARGKAQRRIGDEAGARRSWLQALSAAGGQHPEVENLLGG
jgi:tetratricopeptide (TPR) repeat protein